MATSADNTMLKPDAVAVRGPRFRPRGRIIRAEEAEVWQSGQAYLEAAKREAKRIRGEAVEAFDEAKRHGFEEGRKEGAEAATQLLAETTQKADRYLADADGQLVDLAMAIVQRVLGDLDVRQLVLRAVHHALAKRRKDQPLTLHLSPEMVDQVRLQITESFDDDALHLITIEADPKLTVGECRVASDVGFVDLGVEAQLRALHKGLRGNLKRAARD